MKVRNMPHWSVTSCNTAPSPPQLMVVGSRKSELLQNSPVTTFYCWGHIIMGCVQRCHYVPVVVLLAALNYGLIFFKY
jgi:hypothetical protein